jgi:hypothetical protein
MPSKDGKRLLNRNLPERVEATPATVELPPWMRALRESMNGAIKPDDLKQIMEAQVAKAKKGDQAAARFVIDQAMKMTEAPKGLTVVQNNYYSGPDPREPAKALPGSDGKIDVMRRRLDAGLPLTETDDAERDGA